MKYCLGVLIVLGILGADSLHAQLPNWRWARSGGGRARDQTSSLAVDSIGNVFVTGYYRDSAIFAGVDLNSSAGNHFFLAKYSPNSNLIWIRTSNLKGQSYGTGVCLSQGKYLCLTGYFSDSIAFDDHLLISSGNNDIFLAKYDLDGSAIWAVKGGSPGLDQARSVSSDAFGRIYITGNFSGTALFGSKQVTSIGGDEIFIVQYDSNGSAIWAKRIGASGDDAGWGIAVGESGNFAITGTFSDTVDFGGIKLISPGLSDIFIAKYSYDGNLFWAKQAHDTTSGIGESTAIDVNDNVYVAGRFELPGFVPDCEGSGNIYIAKFDSEGHIVWQKCAGSGGEESGDAIAIDSSGNIFVTGGFDFTFDFGAGPLTHSSFIDGYIVKFDPSGTAQWSDNIGGIGDDEGFAVSSDRSGNVFLGGYFSDTVNCGPFVLQSLRQTDMFIAKIGAKSSVHYPPNSTVAQQVSIFPNPASSAVTIELPLNANKNGVNVELASVLGITIRKVFFPQSGNTNSSLTLQINDLSKGIYICRVRGDGWVESQKFVIGD